LIKPRVYIVTATFLPAVGGAEKQAFAQGRSLRERGYEATVITFRHDRAWPRREVIEGVPVIRVAGLLLGDRRKLPRPLQKLAYLLAMLVMSWLLWRHRRRYHVLHVYKLTSLALLAALVCRLAGKAMLVSVRSAGSGGLSGSDGNAPLPAGPPGSAAPRPGVDGRLRVGGRTVNASSDLEALERMGKPAVRLTRSLLESIHAVVVVLSSRMRISLAEHNFQLPDIELIPNGVDITRFAPVADGTSPAERGQVVVCVSGLRYEKGIDVLLQAWSAVCRQAPQARLIIVGSGSLKSQLERMAGELGVAGSLEFTGLQGDVPAQLCRGSLAVLPSRWEGMPNAVLEAMACGLPCVATRVSGSEDIVEHGVNGLLVEPEDYRAMAQALLTLLADPLLIQKYGRAARETIEKHYSLERVVDRYVELYQRITVGPRRNAEDALSSASGQRSS
jgi:glycosyltransferase involved in cell wall biosynthesis